MAEHKEWIRQIFQLVMVVNDVDETIENWKRLVEFDESSIRFGTTPQDATCVYQGKTIQCPTSYATFDLGGVEMKLVEPLNKEGGDPYSDALRESGQGFHHLGCYIEDRDALLKKYDAAGKKPVYEEICGDSHYLLYDFSDQAGLKIAPWDHMEGPCARV